MERSHYWAKSSHKGQQLLIQAFTQRIAQKNADRRHILQSVQAYAIKRSQQIRHNNLLYPSQLL